MKRLFAALLALALLCGGALAEIALNVTGSGTVYVEADLVSASLGVSISGEDLAVLQQEVSEKMNAICLALQEAGMEPSDISTNYLYITPRYDYSGEIETIIGYSINNSLTIRTGEIEKIGAYIDEAFAAGANSFDSISFTVEDDSLARRQALELAVQDAQSKAETIAAACGKQISAMVSISEGVNQEYWNDSASGGVKYAEAADAAAGIGATVRAAQVKVTAEIQASYYMA